MGLFSRFVRPKISQEEFVYIQGVLNQAQDCASLINTTTKPDVFFKRLNMVLDLLLELQPYEKYGIFKTATPTQNYNRICGNLEATVNDFIDRADEDNLRKLARLKTEQARRRNRVDFAIKLISAFDCANTFWSGKYSPSRSYPHYTGPLFTQANYARAEAIYYGLDEE